MKMRVVWVSALMAGAVAAAIQSMSQGQQTPAGGAAGAMPTVPPGYPTTPVKYETPAKLDAVPAPMKIAIQQAVPYKAEPVPQGDVRITGGPLKRAQDLDAAYLLSLDVNRMMYYLRQRAGLQPKAAQGYGGWDAGQGKQLTGHIAGHYLSAVSYMYAATGDPRFKERVDTLVKELAEVQDKQGDGYIGAQATAQGVDGKTIYKQVAAGQIRSGGFDLNGLWSPWYVEHKIFSGLRDAYRLTGNKDALEVEKKFGAWMESIVGPLSQQQDQQMLATEFGGINESLVCLYADTGDKRWLDLSDKFEHTRVITPMSQGTDNLNNLHGNTTVPKLLGELMRYVYSGNQVDGKAASFFWDEVALHHSFATGGHGVDEHFIRPDGLSAALQNPTARTAESCNVYNMIKYSREMFAIDPLVKYADFHERALFNHVLASINPISGYTSYMVPVGQGVIQEYQNANDFTCCVGSGMESQALHDYGIYYDTGDKVWVNLFVPTTADLKREGMKVEMETSFPDGDDATLKVTASSGKNVTLALRRPYWAGEGFTVKVNGQAVAAVGKPDSYVEISRAWKAGDTVSLTLPKKLWAEPLVDNPTKAALMWGPLVLAGDLGGGGRGRRGGASAAIDGADAPVLADSAPGTDASGIQLVIGDGAEPLFFVAAPAGGGAGAAGGAAGGGRGAGAAGAAGGGRGGRAGAGGPAAQVYPAFVSAQALDQWLKPVADAPAGTFAATGQGAASGTNTIDFIPFYRMYNRRYGIYWDVMTPQQWQQRGGQVVAGQQQAEKLRAATVGFMQPGQMQPETDYNYQAGELTEPLLVADRSGRRATTWMSFDMPVDPSHPMALIVTYCNDETAQRAFDIQVDGKSVGNRLSPAKAPDEPTTFTDVSYDVPSDLVKGKTKVTVKFEGAGGNEVGGVYGIRMVRKDMQ